MDVASTHSRPSFPLEFNIFSQKFRKMKFGRWLFSLYIKLDFLFSVYDLISMVDFRTNGNNYQTNQVFTDTHSLGT